jgi:MoaA/NifB/PqqE/SkfB family radical SAM enzyme
MIDYSMIRSVHFEISTRCNASCPLCPRNTAGFDSDLGYPVHDMSLVEAKQIFTVPFLRQLNKILINGNFGDFVTAKEGVDIVEYFAESNPNLEIAISTNASAKPNIWTRLAKVPNLFVGFDIDGLEDTHSLYRRNTDWNLIISNAKKFIAAGGHAKWRMIPLNHNRHQIDECRRLSKELGFKRFELLDEGRDQGPVYNRDGDLVYQLGDDPMFKEVKYPKRIETWNEWVEPGTNPKARLSYYKTIPVKNKVSCHAKKHAEIYITATGEVYPCCWLGMYPKLEYQYPWQQDNMFIKDMVKNNNALEVGIEQSIAWFNAVEESWNKKAYTEGRLFKCDEYCGS